VALSSVLERTSEKKRSGIHELTRDIVRPDPDSMRLTRNRAVRWAVRITATAVVLAFLLAVVVFPVRDYFIQSSMLSTKTAELAALADANEELQNEVNALNTPEGTRNAARDQLGYVLPGEQRITLLPPVALPTDLPDAWPYTMVTDILTARATEAATRDGALDPLAP